MLAGETMGCGREESGRQRVCTAQVGLMSSSNCKNASGWACGLGPRARGTYEVLLAM